MIKLIPETQRDVLSTAIFRGEIETIKNIVNQSNVDVDAFIDTDSYRTPLMATLTSFGIKTEPDRSTLLQYLLEKGANPNTYCKEGYNCLHIAAQQSKLINALSLFLDFGGDVNLPDNNGGTVAYWAIQSFPWRTEGQERKAFLDVVEKIMMLGADLDIKNKFGVTPRKWLERGPGDLKEIVKKCEKLKPIYKPSKILQPNFPSELLYPDIAKKIWQELVPAMGQADTVQGELLRAVEKLRDEAQRNGNINYGNSHKLLVAFLIQKLCDEKLFEKKEIAKIKAECKKLTKASSPYLEDDLYDYLTDMVCLYYIKTAELIKHEHNPDIY